MDGKLIHLVSDLMQTEAGRQLRRLFNEHPAKVMGLYSLPPEKRQCLYRVDPPPVADEVRAEVEAWGDATRLPTVPGTGKPGSGPLVHLVSDLMHSAHLWRRMQLDPKGVADHYDLGDADREKLSSKDAGTIAARVHHEVNGFTYPYGDFPDGEEPEECGGPTANEGPMVPLYPKMSGRIWCIDPRRARAGERDVPLQVWARSVPREGWCSLSLKAPDGRSIAPSRAPTVSGTFRKSRIECAIDVPEEPGRYEISVVSCAGTPHAYEFESGVFLEVA